MQSVLPIVRFFFSKHIVFTVVVSSGDGGGSEEAGSDTVLAFAASPSGKLLALTDDSKRLVLLACESSWRHVSTRSGIDSTPSDRLTTTSVCLPACIWLSVYLPAICVCVCVQVCGQEMHLPPLQPLRGPTASGRQVGRRLFLLGAAATGGGAAENGSPVHATGAGEEWTGNGEGEGINSSDYDDNNSLT